MNGKKGFVQTENTNKRSKKIRAEKLEKDAIGPYPTKVISCFKRLMYELLKIAL